MVQPLSLAFLIAALVLAILAAVNMASPSPRVNLGWASLACYFASILVSRF